MFRVNGSFIMGMSRERFEMSDGSGRRGGPPATPERLAAAMDRDEIRIAYQPKVSLTDGHLIGVEALARWTDSEIGVVLPHTFIPIAERSGLIGRLTLMVMEQSLETCAALRRLYPAATVAVNDLEERGLVERRADAEDRRVKIVSLTDEGRRIVNALRQVPDHAPPPLSELPPEDLVELVRILKPLAREKR